MDAFNRIFLYHVARRDGWCTLLCRSSSTGGNDTHKFYLVYFQLRNLVNLHQPRTSVTSIPLSWRTWNPTRFQPFQLYNYYITSVSHAGYIRDISASRTNDKFFASSASQVLFGVFSAAKLSKSTSAKNQWLTVTSIPLSWRTWNPRFNLSNCGHCGLY